jgi:hypothetical protein
MSALSLTYLLYKYDFIIVNLRIVPPNLHIPAADREFYARNRNSLNINQNSNNCQIQNRMLVLQINNNVSSVELFLLQ